MAPIMVISKVGQGHKDKYLAASRKILSQWHAHVQYESSHIHYLEVIMTNVNFLSKKKVKCHGQKA